MNSVWYDLMQVCEKGHIITEFGTSDPNSLVKRCPDCGSRTFTKCPVESCGAIIKGYKHVPGVIGGLPHSSPPDFCDECGNSYPWAQKSAVSGVTEPDDTNKILK